MSQRAYLHISNGAIEVFGLGMAAQLIESAQSRRDIPDVAEARVRIAFDLENSGNTPADVTNATVEFDNDAGWIMSEYAVGIPLSNYPRGSSIERVGVKRVELPAIGRLAPKATVHREHIYPVRVFQDALLYFFSPMISRIVTPLGVRGPIKLNAVVAYSDVFQQNQEMSWCWYSNRESKWALECNEPQTGSAPSRVQNR